MSYAGAAFPALTRLYAQGQKEKFVKQMSTSARHIIFWSIPIVVLFVVLRAQIVRTILGAGHFDWADTRLTAAALAIFSLSAVAQGLLVLFVRAYYSQSRTVTPLVINLLTSGLIVVFGYVFVHAFNTIPVIQSVIEKLFKVEGLPGTVILMLPLAYSLGTILNVVLHWIAFHNEFSGFSKPIFKTFAQVLIASLAMGFVSYLLLDVLDDFLNLDTVVGVFTQGFVAGIGGIITAVLILKLIKNEEFGDVVKTLHRKIWKTTEPVFVHEQSEL
jgi:putative peptidoglycan lipid II flippase